jgi:hypothetical protein
LKSVIQPRIIEFQPHPLPIVIATNHQPLMCVGFARESKFNFFTQFIKQTRQVCFFRTTLTIKVKIEQNMMLLLFLIVKTSASAALSSVRWRDGAFSCGCMCQDGSCWMVRVFSFAIFSTCKVRALAQDNNNIKFFRNAGCTVGIMKGCDFADNKTRLVPQPACACANVTGIWYGPARDRLRAWCSITVCARSQRW